MKKGKIRFLYMTLVGVGIFFFLHLLVPKNQQNANDLWNLLTCIAITMIVWEGNINIDRRLDKKYTWETNAKNRILLQLITSTTYTVSSIFISLYFFNTFVCNMPAEQQRKFFIPSILIGLITSFIIISVDISIQFFRHWKNSLVEIEKHKVETAQAQLQNLKNQINPHFLFNNLSVLTSLIYSNQDKAVDFVNQLSKVYRYLLENKDSELTSLEKELTFIQSYIYLIQIRFDKNIEITQSILPASLNTFIPPMSLQILLENAIKHNEISSEKPLHIHIKTTENQLQITNSLQLRRQTEESSKLGLKNIEERYSYFTNDTMHIEQSATEFTVSIPLIAKK